MSRRRTALLAAAAILTIAACDARPAPPPPGRPESGARTAQLPRLVDVGSTTCVPCKAMAPILAQLRADYSGRLQVEFVDVAVPDQGRRAAADYGIRVIPTQIFFSDEGVELSRHQGFMSREDILARWRSHGLAF